MLGSPTDTNTTKSHTGVATSLVGRLWEKITMCKTKEQTAMTVVKLETAKIQTCPSGEQTKDPGQKL